MNSEFIFLELPVNKVADGKYHIIFFCEKNIT